MSKKRQRTVPSSRRMRTTGRAAKKTTRGRVTAMREAPLALCESDSDFERTIATLGDVDEPIAVRLTALQALQAASFSTVAFESRNRAYVAALRAVARDEDPELRQRALGILARNKDGFAQKLLLEGLRQPAKALVPPEKALQLLSYDVHAEAYDVARSIVKDTADTTVKREALRLLSADSTAAPVFEKVLLDKAESTEARQIAASALQSMRPDRLQAHARRIALDADDQDDIRATSLTALTQFAAPASIEGDDELIRGVGALKRASSTKVKKSAQEFLTKYER